MIKTFPQLWDLIQDYTCIWLLWVFSPSGTFHGVSRHFWREEPVTPWDALQWETASSWWDLGSALCQGSPKVKPCSLGASYLRCTVTFIPAVVLATLIPSSMWIWPDFSNLEWLFPFVIQNCLVETHLRWCKYLVSHSTFICFLFLKLTECFNWSIVDLQCCANLYRKVTQVHSLCFCIISH